MFEDFPDFFQKLSCFFCPPLADFWGSQNLPALKIGRHSWIKAAVAVNSFFWAYSFSGVLASLILSVSITSSAFKHTSSVCFYSCTLGALVYFFTPSYLEVEVCCHIFLSSIPVLIYAANLLYYISKLFSGLFWNG